MSRLGKYIAKRMSAKDYEDELQRLIREYNKKQSTYLFVYAASFVKNIPEIPLNMDDYFIISDLLQSTKSKGLHFYIESPGGSAEAAEEIVECFRDKFEHVSFVISGEAKSAGTILALSGNEIYMTDSGSLGPIDAQIKIGRTVSSAYDYMEWVNLKRKEAEKFGKLNPFDATMIAQISPGELTGVNNALNFAMDLIKEWIPKYKFKDWAKTETRKIDVTEEHKKKRAEEIAKALVNHSIWRSHGRSLKIKDLGNYLKINRIDDDPVLADIVYSIQTVIRLLFSSSNTFKIFFTADEKIVRNAVAPNQPIRLPSLKKPDVVDLEVSCPKCGRKYPLYGKFIKNPKIDADFQAKGKINLSGLDKIACECGFTINILGIKNDIEIKMGRKFV